MGCNCKRAMALENEYGTKEKETIFGKIWRYILRGIAFIMVIMMSIVIIPILILAIIYQIIFKDNVNIVLPKILGKYLK